MTEGREGKFMIVQDCALGQHYVSKIVKEEGIEKLTSIKSKESKIPFDLVRPNRPIRPTSKQSPDKQTKGLESMVSNP